MSYKVETESKEMLAELRGLGLQIPEALEGDVEGAIVNRLLDAHFTGALEERRIRGRSKSR